MAKGSPKELVLLMLVPACVLFAAGRELRQRWLHSERHRKAFERAFNELSIGDSRSRMIELLGYPSETVRLIPRVGGVPQFFSPVGAYEVYKVGDFVYRVRFDTTDGNRVAGVEIVPPASQ